MQRRELARGFVGTAVEHQRRSDGAGDERNRRWSLPPLHPSQDRLMMTSLSKLGRFARLSWLMDFGVMCLFVGGFLAASGAMFWCFSRAPRPAQAIQQTASDARQTASSVSGAGQEQRLGAAPVATESVDSAPIRS